MNHFVLLDDATRAQSTLLTGFEQHLRFSANELDSLDHALAVAWDQGLFTFFYIPYEFGVDLVNDELSEASQNNQIHVFCFKEKQTLNIDELNQFLNSYPNEVAGVAEAELSINAADYYQKIEAIHAAIGRGDVYQINFTSTLDFKSYGHPVALYRRLRAQQKVPYGALFNLPLENQQWLLSFSPELFLDIQSTGLVRAKPMKGTAPILNDGQDEQRAIDLKNDSKNRAENLMIVDLLRNDLGRIAKTGTVKVPALFEVTRFGAVWQMTSTVEAEIPKELTFSQLLKATFPCGSITGAPKKMSMQLIKSLEQRQRSIYTGSIGLIEGCDGGLLPYQGQLNVMIRSFHLQEAEGYYQASMGVGSGIVIDSQASQEYDESFWKARFVLSLTPEFAIFETMRWEEGGCALLERHKARLLDSAQALRYPVTTQDLAQGLEQLLKQLPQHGIYRLKLVLKKVCKTTDSIYRVALPNGLSLSATIFDLIELEPNQKLLINKNKVIDAGYLSRYKTDQRAVYDEAMNEAIERNAFDQLLFDKELRLLEGARSNVFLKIKGKWYTPSSDLPLLNGVMRQELLANPRLYLQSSEIIETHLSYDEVIAAEAIVLSNALRGVVPIKERIV